MATMITDSANYTAIANAIRAKGVEGNFTPSQMADAITSIVGGGGGSVEYVPTEKEITPAYVGTKFMFTFLAYSYTQSMELIYTFKEPTDKTYYLNCMTDVGLAGKDVYFDGVKDSSALNQLGYNKVSLNVAIPEGTTTVKIAFEGYAPDYTTTVGFYISETGIPYRTQSSDYYELWAAESPVNYSMFSDISYSQVDSSKVQVQVIEDKTPEQAVVVVPGYLKVSIDDTEYVIYEAEGGTY